MAARRSRKRRRRGRFSFLYKLISTVLILGAIAAGCIVFFRVEEITVLGSWVYTEEEIIAAAGVEVGDNLFLVAEMKAAQRILEQLPYINDVNLRRILPNRLTITVTECTPAVVLADGEGGWWIIDSRGKLLEQGGGELAQRYPSITGLTAQAPAVGARVEVDQQETAKLDSLKALLTALEGRGMLVEVQDIDLSGVSEIRMNFGNRFAVRLPMYGSDFSSLIHAFQGAVEYLDAGQVGTIDLTKENKVRFIPD